MLKTFLILYFLNLNFILNPGILEVNGKITNKNVSSIFTENLGYQFFVLLNKTTHNYLIDKYSDEAECVKQLKKIGTSLLDKEMWAIEVIDSWAKFPAGILRGHTKELGNFEECMKVEAHAPKEVNFQSQYCIFNLPLGQLLKDVTITEISITTSESDIERLFQNLQLQLGICVPKVCSAKILDRLIKDMLNEVDIDLKNGTKLIDEQSCRNNEPYPKNTMFCIAVILLVIFGILMTLSTICDYILCCMSASSSSTLITAFSVKSNGRKLFRIEDYSDAPNIVQCLNGIRSLSIIMVVYGHEYGFTPVLNFINLVGIKEWEKTPYSFIIKNGTLAVDTFFVLSGCLLIRSVFKEMDKNNGKLNVLMMYFHRFIRLTPVLIMAIILSLGIYPHLGSGPFWDLNIYIPNCEKYWWSTILYIQNYVNPSNMCLPHTWYLAVDTHFYILSPLLIIPMYKWGIIGILPGIAVSIFSIIYVFVTWMNKGFHWFVQENTDVDKIKEKLIYYPTHCRIPAYVVGIALGYILFKMRNKNIKFCKLLITFGWLISFTIMAAIIFGLYPKAQNLPNPSGMTTIEGAFFESLSRVLWSIAVAWIIFACHNGYGGLINTFLSWGIWQPIARLSYSIYITHALVTMFIVQITQTDIHFSDIDMMLRFWATFGFTLFLSTFFVLAFELPVLVIEKSICMKKEKNTSN